MLLNDKVETDDYYKFIHLFIKYSIEHLLSVDIIDEFLWSFLNTIMSTNDQRLIACFLIDLSYYFEKDEKKIKNIQKYVNSVDNSENVIILINHVLNELVKHFNNNSKFLIFESQEDTKLTTAIKVIHQILSNNEHSFFEKNRNINNNTVATICSSLSQIKKNSKQTALSSTLEDFEDYFFDILNESRLIQSSILLIFDDMFKCESRNYFLNKYYDIMITNDKLNDKNNSVLEYLIDNHHLEQDNENLQILFSIMTKFINPLKSRLDDFVAR